MSHSRISPELRELARRHWLFYKICRNRQCSARNPYNATKYQRYGSYNLRDKHREITKCLVQIEVISDLGDGHHGQSRCVGISATSWYSVTLGFFRWCMWIG